MKKNSEVFRYLADRILEVNGTVVEAFFYECGEHLDFALLSDDLGTQQAPFISPKDYKEYWKPYHREMISRTKALTDGFIFWHCCGSIFPLIDHLIDIGIDVLNPIQPLAKGMNAEPLKKTYGDRLAFDGGLDVQKLLPRGTVEEVRAEVKRVIEILGENGGYVFAPAHNIQGDVPPQNVVAMFDAALEYGKY
ncbi:MAG: uroporphyrinogen decarboxylase family protein [Candidatus Lokiarchaeia archaeon]